MKASWRNAWVPLLVLFSVGVRCTHVGCAHCNQLRSPSCVLVHMGYNGVLFGMLFYFTADSARLGAEPSGPVAALIAQMTILARKR